jgi:hypothetical protein
VWWPRITLIITAFYHPDRSDQRERSGSGALLRRPERSEGATAAPRSFTSFRAAEAAVSNSFTLKREAGTDFSVCEALHILGIYGNTTLDNHLMGPSVSPAKRTHGVYAISCRRELSGELSRPAVWLQDGVHALAQGDDFIGIAGKPGMHPDGTLEKGLRRPLPVSNTNPHH